MSCPWANICEAACLQVGLSTSVSSGQTSDALGHVADVPYTPAKASCVQMSESLRRLSLKPVPEPSSSTRTSVGVLRYMWPSDQSAAASLALTSQERNSRCQE